MSSKRSDYRCRRATLREQNLATGGATVIPLQCLYVAPQCVRKSLVIPICHRPRLQLIPNLPSGHSALVLAFLRNGDRDRPGLCELADVRSGSAGVDATLVGQLPREACDLAIVKLPFWDLTRTRELGLFL
jgi:hypothetical protein